MKSARKYHEHPSRLPPPPAGCPMHRAWSPLDIEYLADPYPIAAQLHSEHPVFYAPEIGCLVVTDMADIEAIFADHETFASVNVQDPIYALAPEAAEVLAARDYNPVAVMSNRSEPDHGRIRQHARSGFSVRRIRTLEPYIRRRCEELVDAMITAGAPSEFVAALAFPLPGETVFRFIGFPEKDDEVLKQWCIDRKAFSWGHPTPDEQLDIALQMLAYWRYCREFTSRKRLERGDDFTSELINAHEAHPDELTYREVESIVYGLSFAGHEAVTALLCNALLCLLPRREVWSQICADPALVPNAVEEVLRFNSSQISWRRLTTCEANVAGVTVPAGTPILLNFASANRQSDIWERPDQFDIRRPDAARHISFGKGVHYCLGAQLARVEARIVVEVLSERLPSLRLVEAQELHYSSNITFRGPTELQVTWNAADTASSHAIGPGHGES